MTSNEIADPFRVTTRAVQAAVKSCDHSITLAGRQIPSNEELTALSRVLGVPVGKLHQLIEMKAKPIPEKDDALQEY